jgi:cytochrome c biogenesis protein CcmG, thiol:disulfide interchange protein DsbE
MVESLGQRFVLALVAAVALSFPAAAQSQASPPLELSKYRGQVVLVDFWASWCVPCRQSFPWMTEMREKYGGRGLVIVAVNLDEDPDKAARFLKDSPGDFVHEKDPNGGLARAYGVEVMPTSLLFDREGRPVYRHEGFHPERKREYEGRILELLESRGPSAALTIAPARAVKLGVPPWQRSVLADPAMQLIADPLEIELDDHIYFSKEASSGGRGFGGGGCGCN